MTGEMYFPDELDPDALIFVPNRAPLISETRRLRDRNRTEDRMFDGRTLVIMSHGARIIGYSYAYLGLPNEKLLELDGFVEFVDGQPFRMRDFVTNEFSTFKDVGATGEDIFRRTTTDGDGWDVGMRVEKVN